MILCLVYKVVTFTLMHSFCESDHYSSGVKDLVGLWMQPLSAPEQLLLLQLSRNL